MKRSHLNINEDAVVADYARGDGIHTLAAKYDISVFHVQNILKDRGVYEGRTRVREAERNKDIVARYEGGATMPEIAEALGLSKGAIRYVLAQAGTTIRPAAHSGRPRTRPPYTPDEEQRIIAGYQSGMSVSALSDQFGGGHARIKDVFRRHDVAYRDRLNLGADPEIGRRYLAGESIPQIARSLGCSNTAVRGALVEQDVPRRVRAKHRPTPKHQFTDEQKTDMVARYEAGTTGAELARAYSCSQAPIVRVLREAGVYNPTRSRRGAKYTAEERAEMVQRYNAGEAIHPLAEVFETTPQALHKILVGLGVTMRSKGGKYPGVPVRSTDKKSGYVKVLVSEDDPIGMAMAWANGFVFEHRLVMAHHLGRPLKGAENVHHVRTDDKGDNRLENLELWTTQQPTGQRVADKIAWALEFLAEYGETPTVDVVVAALERLAGRWIASQDPGDPEPPVEPVRDGGVG